MRVAAFPNPHTSRSCRTILLIIGPALIAAAPTRTSELRVLPSRVLRAFRPEEAFGVAIDGGDAAEARALLNRKNAPAMRAAGFKSASYRLRTELAGQVWHWSSYGRWSDQEHHQGYWIGDASRDDDHDLSFGYRLPRRGNSRDEANDDGFSRIDDGDVTTFWKSNPYLDPKLDGIGIERQWVIADLGRRRSIDTAQIRWAEPYAAQFLLQRWVGADQYDGKWSDLTSILSGHAGLQSVVFAPATTRFVRILLEKSSHVSAGKDPRDAMGYAISELEIGSSSASEFHDYVRHSSSGRQQTRIAVSSTDPWHREVDLDPDAVQPSLVELHARDLFAGPFMIPLPLLTDTPDNAIEELQYFRRRGVPIKAVELGEEPEGQLAPPRMVAALYGRLASRIARKAPGILIGGPSLIDPAADTTLDDEDESWTGAFLQSLRRSHPTAPIAFLSTELYPVENLCDTDVQMLRHVARAPERLAARFGEDGAGELAPVITEYGLSPYGGKALEGIVAALADAEILAKSISKGVTQAYLYGTSPTSPVRGKRPCAGSGNLTLWTSDLAGHIISPSIRLRVFQALRDRWSNPEDTQEQLVAIGGAPAGIDAFALKREDTSVSILLINRTPKLERVRLHALGKLSEVKVIIVDHIESANSLASAWPKETTRSLPAEIEIKPESLTILTLGSPG
jgi:hypothetical protein